MQEELMITQTHVFIVMLGYIINQQLEKYRKKTFILQLREGRKTFEDMFIANDAGIYWFYNELFDGSSVKGLF